MKRWFGYLVIIALMAGSWVMFSNKGKEIDQLKIKLEAVQNQPDTDEETEVLASNLQAVEGERIFSGVLLTFLSAGLVGVFFVFYLLPFFAQRVTHAVYDSAEMVEKDIMHDGRSLLAQGDYEGAIASFRKAAAADPLNRLPWVEIAKIYRTNLHDSKSAIQTIRHALESQEWQINDAAYFLFRLAELYDENQEDRVAARTIMQQVVDEFPNSRHSANAKHKLADWNAEEEAAAKLAEEEQYLARTGGSPGPTRNKTKRHDLSAMDKTPKGGTA